MHLDKAAFWRQEVSDVFHGRDIFAPVAAHLAAGVHLNETGSAFADPVLLEFPRAPTRARWPGGRDHSHRPLRQSGLQHHAGGHGSDARRSMIEVHLGPTRITGLVETFGEREPGEVVALFGSTGNLIVSVVNGSAASRLRVHVGEAIRVVLIRSPKRVMVAEIDEPHAAA